MQKYLAIWMGVVSGSLGGRDDGYPEEKRAIVLEPDLHKYATIRGVQFYALPNFCTDVSSLVKQQLEAIESKKKSVITLKQNALAKLSPAEKKALGI